MKKIALIGSLIITLAISTVMALAGASSAPSYDENASQGVVASPTNAPPSFPLDEAINQNAVPPVSAPVPSSAPIVPLSYPDDSANQSDVAVPDSTNPISYYDENGNQIVINGLYYNNQGCPMFNAGCYYLDADGNPVYVGGCRAYYYDADGNLVAGNYYYDQNGNAVSRPSSYPGGYGCGMWYYNSQGNVVNQSTYYDDFGNPIEPPPTPSTPSNPAPVNRGCGCGCGWRR